MDFRGDSSSATSQPRMEFKALTYVAIYHSNIRLIYFKEDNISLSCVLSSGSLVVIIIGACNLSANDKQDNTIPPCHDLIAPFIDTHLISISR
jgi:hypothetical protein